MPDAYVPTLDTFQLAADELAVIAVALNAPDPWQYASTDDAEVAALKSAKAKILDYHLQRHNWQCCYCRTNLHGAGPFMTDREHILPKGKPGFKPYSYEMWNLAAACKRCNMQFKGQSDAFVVDKVNADKLKDGKNYLFVHPNFDCWEDHLGRIDAAAGGKRVIGFYLVSDDPKSHYTYIFFKLEELVINTFDKQQQALTQAQSTDLGREVLELAEKHSQRRG